MIDPESINLMALPSVALEERSQLPSTPCVYFAIDSLGAVQYIGRTINLNQRWIQHHRYVQLSKMEAVRIAYLFSDVDLLPSIEAALIKWFQPSLNGAEIELGLNDKRKVSAYLSEDLKEKAEKLAAVEKRSLSNFIEVLLQSAVDKFEAEGRSL
jgi:CopG-like RHH_1 or ribbon-helix-helix domain, RHH_5/GIY-YIG catalytic domain